MSNNWKKILKISLIAASLPVLIMLIIFIRAFRLLESKQELLNYKNAEASVVLSREGEIVGKIFTENRTSISFDQIPGHLVHALITTEDVRFFDHHGVDLRSLLRVFFKTILLNKESAGGGSTLTQQLAKNMFGRINTPPFALLVNKTKELMLARRIEKLFTKDEILTFYLNTVPFGENVFGIEAASMRYFNKKIAQLKVEESAVLVGMLKANHLFNPRLYSENAKKRRNLVLNLMYKQGFLDESEKDSLCELPLKTDYVNIESAGPADYFLYQVKYEAEIILKKIRDSGGKEWNIEEDGLIIKTPLILSLQKSANRALKDHIGRMQKRLEDQFKGRSGRNFLNSLVENELRVQDLASSSDEIAVRQVFDWTGSHSDSMSIEDSIRHNIKLLHAGIIGMDPATGEVSLWLGGIDYKTQPYDQVLARRQMGSTLKPILYAAAFEEGMSPCRYLDNDSISLAGYEEWHPSNFDKTYGGKYSLTGALVHSMNIPTLNLYLEIGFGRLNALWHEMGFSFDLVNTPALAMGTAEASIMELAVAYAAFANGGFKIEPQILSSIESRDGEVIWKNDRKQPRARILSERTCGLMNTILMKAVREGTGSSLYSAYGVNIQVAGKTGTSQDYTDAWFAAYNPSVVIVSRVGASLPAVHFNSSSYGTGSALALPLVGLTLSGIKGDSKLLKQLGKTFPITDTELSDEFECPDYKEKDVFDEIREFLSRDEIRYDTLSDRPARKKRSFFRRIFRKDE